MLYPRGTVLKCVKPIQGLPLGYYKVRNCQPYKGKVLISVSLITVLGYNTTGPFRPTKRFFGYRFEKYEPPFVPRIGDRLKVYAEQTTVDIYAPQLRRGQAYEVGVVYPDRPCLVTIFDHTGRVVNVPLDIFQSPPPTRKLPEWF